MNTGGSPDHGASPATTVAGSTRAYAVVLLVVVVFILYGSLFPFEYQERSYPGGPVAYLLSTWHDWDGRGDLLSNILLYLPFGFFTTVVLPSRIPAVVRALLASLAGAALACGVEITQFHDVGRVTTMGDVYANGIGAAMGAVAAAVAGSSLRWPFVAELAADPVAAVLLAMFFGYRFYPYVPTIDLHKYWHALWPVLRSPSLPPEDLAHYIITWLFIAAIIDSLYGFRRFLPVFPLLVCIEFAGKVLIVGAFLKATDVVGGVAAYLLWVSPLRRVPGRSIVVAVAFAVMIALERLQPYQFLAAPREFGWIPFYSFMHGSIGIDMQAFCQKFYEYGGLIWLLGCCGVTLPSGTGLTAGLLLATSVAECWLPGRSAEITDGIMALVIGGAFVMLERAAWPRAAAALAPHRVSSQPPRRRGSKYGPYVPPRLRG